MIFKVPLRFLRGLFNNFKDPEFLGLLFFVILILTIGTAFYMHVEKWSLLDSFYFSVTTLATIGYGDLAPTTNLSKMFTIGYIFVGVGTLFAFINLIAHSRSKE